MKPLIESLFRVALARPELERSEVQAGGVLQAGGALQAELAGASVDQWGAALRTLRPHRMLPLLYHQLLLLDGLSALPTPIREQLERSYHEIRACNIQLILSTATLLRALEQRGQTPLVMKGVVLADGYYADFGARPMGDIDLVAAPGHDEALLLALTELGYARTGSPPEDDAVVLTSKTGVVCDAHRRLRLFEEQPWEDVTRLVELVRMRGLSVRVLEPNAMLAHAVAHMAGHLSNLGPMLLWIMDLTFIIRRHTHELELARIERLLSDARMRTLLLRVLALLSQYGEELPQTLRDACRRVPALSLAFILRQRRLTPWGLPAPMGWVRLCAHHLALREYERFDVPELQDLMLWPVDLLASNLLPRIVGRSAV